MLALALRSKQDNKEFNNHSRTHTHNRCSVRHSPLFPPRQPLGTRPPRNRPLFACLTSDPRHGHTNNAPSARTMNV